MKSSSYRSGGSSSNRRRSGGDSRGPRHSSRHSDHRGPRSHGSGESNYQNGEKKGVFGKFMDKVFGGNPDHPHRQERGDFPRRSGGGRPGGSFGGRKRSESSGPSRLQEILNTPPEVNTPRLYIGNLSYQAAESDLFDLFSQVGAVKNVEIVRDNGGQSKGFGFAEMQTLETAQAVAQKFHAQDFMGRPMIVNGAKPSPASA